MMERRRLVSCLSRNWKNASSPRTTTRCDCTCVIGYITPQDKLNGKDQEIFDARDRSRDVKFVRFCGRCMRCVDFGGGRSDATA
jgi:hypothetical protein